MGWIMMGKKKNFKQNRFFFFFFFKKKGKLIHIGIVGSSLKKKNPFLFLIFFFSFCFGKSATVIIHRKNDICLLQIGIVLYMSTFIKTLPQ